MKKSLITVCQTLPLLVPLKTSFKKIQHALEGAGNQNWNHKRRTSIVILLHMAVQLLA